METATLIDSLDVAAALGKSREAFWKWKRRHPDLLPPVKVVGRSQLWDPDEVEAFIKSKIVVTESDEF